MKEAPMTHDGCRCPVDLLYREKVWNPGRVPGEGGINSLRKTKEALPPIVSAAVDRVLERQALDPVLLDVRGLCGYTDYLLILGGRSPRQVRAVAEGVLRGLRQDGFRPYGQEGMDESRWVLLDYSDVVIHILLEELRDFYELESLWAEAPRKALVAAAPAMGASSSPS